ncbi:MAG: hypothetical protein U9Q66_03410 [Patescibacteria group bacterium]|nr:hypothetical protein [Patescibacteria group bacterium]
MFSTQCFLHIFLNPSTLFALVSGLLFVIIPVQDLQQVLLYQLVNLLNFTGLPQITQPVTDVILL